MIGKTLNELKIGDKAEFAKTISEFDIYMFAGITGDFNPAHINEDYAKQTFFKTRIAHGILTAGLISTVIGTKLPGTGTVYVSFFVEYMEGSVKAESYEREDSKGAVTIIELPIQRNQL